MTKKNQKKRKERKGKERRGEEKREYEPKRGYVLNPCKNGQTDN